MKKIKQDEKKMKQLIETFIHTFSSSVCKIIILINWKT